MKDLRLLTLRRSMLLVLITRMRHGQHMRDGRIIKKKNSAHDERKTNIENFKKRNQVIRTENVILERKKVQGSERIVQ